jgi:hypothetical protein
MAVNYSSLLALNPDLFPLILPQQADYDQTELSAYRLINLFEQSGYNASFMQELN